MTYPVLDFAPQAGVIPIVNAVMPYDSAQTYKIAIDLYYSFKDSTKVYEPFTEIACTYNLHFANGVPADKIKIAAVIPEGLSKAVISNDAYHEKYRINNPNMLALQELKKVDVEVYLCGQSMVLLQIPPKKYGHRSKSGYFCQKHLRSLGSNGLLLYRCEWELKPRINSRETKI